MSQYSCTIQTFEHVLKQPENHDMCAVLPTVDVLGQIEVASPFAVMCPTHRIHSYPILCAINSCHIQLTEFPRASEKNEGCHIIYLDVFRRTSGSLGRFESLWSIQCFRFASCCPLSSVSAWAMESQHPVISNAAPFHKGSWSMIPFLSAFVFADFMRGWSRHRPWLFLDIPKLTQTYSI